MNKQEVKTTSSMNRKGYSSSSHYRISSGLGTSERAVSKKWSAKNTHYRGFREESIIRNANPINA